MPEFIIDAGANIGLSSVFFAERFPTARIIAIEPEPSNFVLLKRNTRIYQNIIPIQAGIWSVEGDLNIVDGSADHDAFQLQENTSGSADSIKALTIPRIMEMHGADNVDILKLDIEAAEKELFASGWEDWLGKVHLIYIELHDSVKPGCSIAFYRAIVNYDFIQYSHGETICIKK